MPKINNPLFSIITPTYNGLNYLPFCTRSVSDQKELAGPLEHWVMDGGSTDGSTDWLQQNHPSGYWLSEQDQGMYDAINKGLDRCQGSIISYLNCDEQYLPGTLAHVAAFFENHPECDILFGDALLIRPDGSYLASRRGYPPRWYFMGASQLYVLSCTMFFRRSVIKNGLRFNPEWRAVGDLDFVLRTIAAGFKLKHQPRYTSAFVMTGENLGGGAIALEELMSIRQAMPSWVRRLRFPLNVARLGLKLISGAYGSDRGRTYAVYTGLNPTARTTFTIERTQHGWPAR